MANEDDFEATCDAHAMLTPQFSIFIHGYIELYNDSLTCLSILSNIKHQQDTCDGNRMTSVWKALALNLSISQTPVAPLTNMV